MHIFPSHQNRRFSEYYSKFELLVKTNELHVFILISILDARKLIFHDQTQNQTCFYLRNYTWQGNSRFSHIQTWKRDKKVLWWQKNCITGTYIINTDGHVCCQILKNAKMAFNQSRNICRNQTQKKLSFECFSIVLKYKLISHLYTFRHFVNCLKLLPVYSAIVQSWVVSSGNFCPTFLAFRVSP